MILVSMLVLRTGIVLRTGNLSIVVSMGGMHTLIIAARVLISMGSMLMCVLSTNYNPGGRAHTWGVHSGNLAGMLLLW